MKKEKRSVFFPTLRGQSEEFRMFIRRTKTKTLQEAVSSAMQEECIRMHEGNVNEINKRNNVYTVEKGSDFHELNLKKNNYSESPINNRRYQNKSFRQCTNCGYNGKLGWEENVKDLFCLQKLLTAAAKGNIKEVELCVKNGANLECRGGFGQTPLMLAARGGHLEVVTYLVTQGSQLEATSPVSGWTPLMLAAMYGHLEVVTYLVTHGSQLDATSTLDGQTALHLASGKGQIDVTKCLIDQGCSPWVKTLKVTFSFILIR
ncbi:ankyrin repeat and SAM domain-containing protein 6-like [Mytilus trossulus]|uniref:ankyrin repeat and SAM domain-containing protein 6-like n=1 Tax=Mytilus trossulus TaxID=6551 RepID=UPI003005A1CC